MTDHHRLQQETGHHSVEMMIDLHLHQQEIDHHLAEMMTGHHPLQQDIDLHLVEMMTDHHLFQQETGHHLAEKMTGPLLLQQDIGLHLAEMMIGHLRLQWEIDHLLVEMMTGLLLLQQETDLHLEEMDPHLPHLKTISPQFPPHLDPIHLTRDPLCHQAALDLLHFLLPLPILMICQDLLNEILPFHPYLLLLHLLCTLSGLVHLHHHLETHLQEQDNFLHLPLPIEMDLLLGDQYPSLR